MPTNTEFFETDLRGTPGFAVDNRNDQLFFQGQPVSQQQAQNILESGQAGTASISSGGNTPGQVVGQGNQAVFIPEFVDFNPEEFFINLESAIAAADEQGARNIVNFLQNFDIGDQLADETIQTELRGLETFLPRASNLIRESDAQGNNDILSQSDVFDARNERQVRRATEGNVTLRANLFEQQAPGVRDSIDSQRSRFQGDISRIRSRESEPFLDESLREVASRSARNNASDIAASRGFGVDSSATDVLLDRFDLDTRLQLEQAERDDARRGDVAIREAENSISRLNDQSTSIFNSVIAPGILDFAPIQAIPRVTDIGGQIPATPSVDAGTLRREFTNNLTNISTLSPSEVFNGSFREQEFNSGVGLQALAFEQDQNNVVADAFNTNLDKIEERDRFEIAQANFQEALEIRQQSQNTQATTSLISTGASLVGEFLGNIFRSDGTATGGTNTTGNGSVASNVANTLIDIFSQGSPEAEAGRIIAENGGAEFVANQVNSFLAGEAGVTLAGAGQAAAILAYAIGTGQGLAETIEDFTDGSVNSDDIRRGTNILANPNAAFWNGINDFTGERVSPDIANLALSLQNPISAAVAFSTFVADGLGLDIDLFGSGKNEEQQFRDGLRDNLEEQGVAQRVNGSHVITLADGSTYDIGVDGSNRLSNVGQNIDGNTERFTFDVDFSNPLSAQTVGFVNPLSTILFNSPEGSRFVGHLTNAVQSSNPNDLENIRLNSRGIALDAGISYAEGVNRLDRLNQLGQLDDATYAAYRNGWFDLFFG